MMSAALIAAALSGAGGGPTYDTDAAAYFARMGGTQESDTFKGLVNTAIVDLKAAGCWAGLDYLSWFATNDPANRLYDLRDATATWTVGGTTTHTPLRGIKGDGSTGYIGHPATSLAAGANYDIDLAIIGAYCNQQNTGTGTRQPHFGGVSAARTNILAHDSGTDNGRVNQTADSTGIHTSTTRKGLRMAVRTGASATQWYYNGTAQAAPVNGSATPDAFQATGLRNGTAYCDDQLAFMFSGGAAWNSTQAAAFHTIMHALATGLGANY